MPPKSQSDKTNHLKKIAAAMKALSNENRLAMFEHIRAGHGRGSP